MWNKDKRERKASPAQSPSNNRPHQRIGRRLSAGKLVQFAQRLPLIDPARMFGIEDEFFKLGGSAVGFGRLRLAQPAVKVGQRLLRLRGKLGCDKLLQFFKRLVMAIIALTVGVLVAAPLRRLRSVDL